MYATILLFLVKAWKIICEFKRRLKTKCKHVAKKGPELVDEVSDGVEIPEDNWVHRSNNMKCSTCMFYVSKRCLEIRDPDIGRCRKKAPTLDGWPAVFGGDWCGDHKIDENKI